MGDVYQIIYWYNINPRILPILRVKLMIYYSKGKYCYIRTYPSLFPKRISNRDNRSFIYQFGTKSFQINLFATSNYLICENRFLSSHRSDNNSMFFLYTAYIVMCILHVMSQFVIIALCCNTCPNLEYILPYFVIRGRYLTHRVTWLLVMWSSDMQKKALSPPSLGHNFSLFRDHFCWYISRN